MDRSSQSGSQNIEKSLKRDFLKSNSQSDNASSKGAKRKLVDDTSPNDRSSKISRHEASVSREIQITEVGAEKSQHQHLEHPVSPGDSVSHSERNALSNSSEKSEESSIGIDNLDPNRLMRGASTLRRYAGQLIESANTLEAEGQTQEYTSDECREQELNRCRELQEKAVTLFKSQIGIDELAKALQERKIDHNRQEFENIWGKFFTSEEPLVKSVISIVKRQSIIRMRQKRQS